MDGAAPVASPDGVEETRTLPGRYYHDPTLFALEQENIFSRFWVCVGRADQLGDAGSYALHQVGNESVIVLRDRDRQVRAFLNVCRHRGSRLCTTEQGHLPATVQCPYHAWTYTLDGRLVGAPNMRSDPSFDPARRGLIAVGLDVWEGLIWLNLSDHPRPLAAQLGTLYSHFAHYRVGDLARAVTIGYDVQANCRPDPSSSLGYTGGDISAWALGS
ncbi:MAG: hypothetical protein NVSMB65_19770 [Chloroflexota bacterium]